MFTVQCSKLSKTSKLTVRFAGGGTQLLALLFSVRLCPCP